VALYKGHTPEEYARVYTSLPVVKTPKKFRKSVPGKIRARRRGPWTFPEPKATERQPLAAPVRGLKKVQAQTRPTNPLPTERERPKMFEGGLYSREQHDIDVLALENIRHTLRERFLEEGFDGIKYKQSDDYLLAEIDKCDLKLKMTGAVIQGSIEAKKKGYATPKEAKSKWHGVNEAQAHILKVTGHEVRIIEAGRTKQYQVKIK
jgi:hypothetical protein